MKVEKKNNKIEIIFEELYEKVLLIKTIGGIDIVPLRENNKMETGFVLRTNKIIIEVSGDDI